LERRKFCCDINLNVKLSEPDRQAASQRLRGADFNVNQQEWLVMDGQVLQKSICPDVCEKGKI
jgi:hypothetical protein